MAPNQSHPSIWSWREKKGLTGLGGFGETGEVLMVGVSCRGQGGVLVRIWWKSGGGGDGGNQGAGFGGVEDGLTV